MTRRRLVPLAMMAIVALLATACGDDADGGAGGGANAEAATCRTKATATQLAAVDADRDGRLTIGVITPGPRNDGGYYEALVECVERIVDVNGGRSIVVDNVPAADAATQMENLARQRPDIIMVGASQLASPLADLSKRYDSIYWYCNCGAGQQPVPTYSQSTDDSSEISFTAGYATGLLLKQAGKSKAGFVGNNKDQLAFEVEAFEAFALGLKAVDPAFEAIYASAGDFNDVQKATAAYRQLQGQGVGAVYPFLGGAHEPVVKLANADKVLALSAGTSDACERSDLDYAIAVRFDAGDYLDPIFAEILDGTFREGTVRQFRVGKDPQPGAVICDATSAQTSSMDAVYRDIAGGRYTDAFFAIKKAAYKF